MKKLLAIYKYNIDRKNLKAKFNILEENFSPVRYLNAFLITPNTLRGFF